MKLWSWMLTLLAVLVLSVTVAILLWLRDRSERAIEISARNTELSVDAESILGDPAATRVDFAGAETMARNARRNPSIRDLVLTKRLAHPGQPEVERPVVPYDLLAREGADWPNRFMTWRRVPIKSGETVAGYLYLDLDRSSVVAVRWATLAASVALVAALGLLIVRLYTRETRLVRAGLELEERKRELIRLERLALAGQLTAGLLHDLKKPVAHIRHSLEDLREALGDFAGAATAVTDARAQTDLFFEMLGNSGVERFVRSDRVQEEYVDVNQTLESALSLVHYERHGVGIEKNLAPGLPPVLAQPFRLIQVFSNLILNAYQALQGAGTIHLESRAEGEGIEVIVGDDGPGIPPELRDSVFEPFFTTKAEAEGSGLGLAISRLIVEELGGKIDLLPASARGTRFRVWLPCDRASKTLS